MNHIGRPFPDEDGGLDHWELTVMEYTQIRESVSEDRFKDWLRGKHIVLVGEVYVAESTHSYGVN